MPRVQVESVQGPARRQIIKRLIAFNACAVGKAKYKSFTVTLRQGKEIVGGLTGSTWMGWLFIDLLWIADKYRGKGYGKALMDKAEAEARKRGAMNVFLNTFDF
jgi:GNAT superfamily N-acetyltransferase